MCFMVVYLIHNFNTFNICYVTFHLYFRLCPQILRLAWAAENTDGEFRRDYTSGHPYLEFISTEPMLWEWEECPGLVLKVTREEYHGLNQEAHQGACKETAREVGEVLAEGHSRNQVRRVFQEDWNGQQYGQCMWSDQHNVWSMVSTQSPAAVNR